MTFLASHPTRINASQSKALDALVFGTDFFISYGRPEIGQMAVTLCFHGAREYADKAVIDRFTLICKKK